MGNGGCPIARSLFLVLVMSMAKTAEAENYLYYFGGGGESKQVLTTRFDQGLKALGRLQSRGWKVTALDSGPGHSESKLLGEQVLGVPTRDFTNENINQVFLEIRKNLRKGFYTSDDQILFIFNTHGGEATNKFMGGIWATYDGYIPREDLLNLIGEFKNTRVRLALVDTSCFGGQSVVMAPSNLCAVSMTTSRRISRIGIGQRFIGALAESGRSKNSSIEDLYLNLRLANDYDFHYLPHQWQISGQVGEMTGSALAPFEKVLWGDEEVDLEGKAKSPEETMVDDVGFRQIDMVLGTLSLMTKKNYSAWSIDIDKDLKSYNQLREVLAQKFLGTLCAPAPSLRRCDTRLSLAFCLARKCEDLSEFNESEIKPIAEQAEKYRDEFLNLARTTSRLAKMEREIYDGLYKYNSTYASAPNPCRDFKID